MNGCHQFVGSLRTTCIDSAQCGWRDSYKTGEILLGEFGIILYLFDSVFHHREDILFVDNGVLDWPRAKAYKKNRTMSICGLGHDNLPSDQK